MGKHSPVAIVPKYMAAFQCIGPACEDTCCQGWTVGIDKNAYKNYRTIRIEPLASKLKTHMVKIENPQDGHYGVLKMDDDGLCAFLGEDKLCDLHRQLGPEHLSRTCNDYPRHYTQKNDQMEMHANLSCPEAARLALLVPDGMERQDLVLPFANANTTPCHVFIQTGKPEHGLLRELFDLVFETAYHIAGDADGKAWEAMIVMSVMVRTLTTQLADGGARDVRGEIARSLLQYFDPQHMGRARVLARQLTPNRSAQLSLLRAMLERYVANHPAHVGYAALVDDTLKGLGWDAQDPLAMEREYEAAERDWFTPFDDAHPHILRNYIRNDLGKNLFPLGKGQTAEKAFMELALRFSLVRLHLIGLAGLKKEAFGEADYIRTIYTFTRNVEHHGRFQAEILDALGRQGLGNLATAAVMLR